MTAHCESCGSTNPEDLQTEDGYTACCNEPICYQPANYCRFPQRHKKEPTK